MQAAFPHHSLMTMSDFLVRSRHGVVHAPAGPGGKRGIPKLLQTKLLNFALSHIILPSAVQLGDATWCSTTAAFPSRGGCRATAGGEHEGSPRLAPAKLFFHPRNAASPGETYPSPTLLPFESTCPAKGLTGTVLPSPILHADDLKMKLFGQKVVC